MRASKVDGHTGTEVGTEVRVDAVASGATDAVASGKTESGTEVGADTDASGGTTAGDGGGPVDAPIGAQPDSGTTGSDVPRPYDGAVEAPDCDSGNCFCEALRSCPEGIGQMAWLPLGSQGWRVCGHDQRPDEGPDCRINVFVETEGAESVYRCFAPDTYVCEANAFPYPSSLDCEHVLDCGRPGGDCPADVLACSPSSPTCAAVDPKSFGPGAVFLGYAFDGTGCIGVSGDCGDQCNALFATRDSCWQACSRSCTDVAIARAKFHDENAQCTTDADCAWASTFAPPYDHCSCVVALNRKADLAKWQALNSSYGCFQGGACCDGLPGPAACNDGHCGPHAATVTP